MPLNEIVSVTTTQTDINRSEMNEFKTSSRNIFIQFVFWAFLIESYATADFFGASICFQVNITVLPRELYSPAVLVAAWGKKVK